VRLVIAAAAAALLLASAASSSSATASFQVTKPQVTDLSSAKKKTRSKKKPAEQYLRAVPSR
jgi:hypothetical protein